MNNEELISKLEQIEEQARLTLEELPQNLRRERQRMIVALAKYIRSELADRTQPLDVPSASLPSTARGH